MKPLVILGLLGLAGVGLYLLFRKDGFLSGLVGSSGSAPGQTLLLLTDTTTAAPGADGGIEIGSGDEPAGSDRSGEMNDALATDEPVEAGLFSTFEDVLASSVEFVREQPHPLDPNQTQRIFRLGDDADPRFDAIRGQGRGSIISSVGDPRRPDTFIEFLPTGSGSTSLNVIETGIAKHGGRVSAPATLKEGDPGHSEAVKAARERVSQARRATEAANKRRADKNDDLKGRLGDQILRRAGFSVEGGF